MAETPTHCNARQGFVYERVPHITLRDIANNSEIDDIYDQFQHEMEPIRAELNSLLKTEWQEWEIPRAVGRSVARCSNRDVEPAVQQHQRQRKSGATTQPEQRTGQELHAGRPTRTTPRSMGTREATKLHERWWKLRIDSPEGDRRLNRRQRQLRVPLRQTLRGPQQGPSRRPVHS